MGKPVVLVSQLPANSTLDVPYAPGLKALDAGAIPTGNMTPAAAMVKVAWALARCDDPTDNAVTGHTAVMEGPMDRFERLMARNFVGEMEP